MILVTGATGFVGRRLIPALKESFPAEPIRIMVHSYSPGVSPEDVEIFRGDLKYPKIVQALVKDADVIIHLAANVRTGSHDICEMRRINTEATRNLYSAAVQSGAKLFVHVSSAGVYGPPRSAAPFREDDACKPATAYQISKFEAEEALLKTDSKQTILNILRPTIIYGSGRIIGGTCSPENGGSN
jgi:nucleoside-diphosphate-sugar epimerase